MPEAQCMVAMASSHDSICWKVMNGMADFPFRRVRSPVTSKSWKDSLRSSSFKVPNSTAAAGKGVPVFEDERRAAVDLPSYAEGTEERERCALLPRD